MATADAAPKADPAKADPATTAPSLDPAKTDAKDDDAKDDAKKDDKSVVPEKYELKAPEGTVVDAEVTTAFEAKARELGLSQEKAQELYDLGAQAAQKTATAFQAEVGKIQEGWLQQSTTDPEISAPENLAVARRAMQFATPELKQFLNDSRVGDHPEMVRWMYRVGKAMSQDSHIQATQRPASRDETEEARAKRLYPNQN